MKKKILAMLLCGGVLLGNTLTAFADSGAGVSMTWDTYDNGRGIIDGSKSGKYYSLTAGDVTLEATSVSGPGTKYLDLRRKSGLVSYGYGEVAIYGSGSYKWKVDRSSDSYFFIGRGGNAGSTQHISGKFHNH
ncbi:hypothetical protein [Clostridium hydrogeniformans]|uniref:hypothetical protein n=1 Tax=Clostridium hydrogeniformans TaxID=349933 RepID=UPI00048723BA|nr:hypothetical protein [Clostridium hydrogeniformans]